MGETEGKDGYFITKEEFFQKEWIAKTNYSGNFYGITHKEIEPLKRSHMVYVIDWDGFIYMKNKLKPIHKNAEAISIFIDVNIEDLQNRMIKQQRSDTEIKKRMDRLHMDLQVKYKCDYIIENKTTLENAVSQLHAIITQTNKVHC